MGGDSISDLINESYQAQQKIDALTKELDELKETLRLSDTANIASRYEAEKHLRKQAEANSERLREELENVCCEAGELSSHEIDGGAPDNRWEDMREALIMPAGRPLKFVDGDYFESAIEDILYESVFNSEKSLVSHTKDHISDILGEEIISFQEEVVLPLNVNRKFSKFRVDLVAVAESGKTFIIECKNPKFKGSLDIVGASAQVKLYGDIYRGCSLVDDIELVVVTGKINKHVSDFYRKHAQDVRLIIVGDSYTASCEAFYMSKPTTTEERMRMEFAEQAIIDTEGGKG